MSIKPILLDETGLKMVEALNRIADKNNGGNNNDEKGNPRLIVSQLVKRTSKAPMVTTDTDDYVVFVDAFQSYDNGSKRCIAIYGLTERPVYNSNQHYQKQHVYRSFDGGDTWEKLFSLDCHIPNDYETNGSWYNSLFVDALGETFYFLRTNDGMRGENNSVRGFYVGKNAEGVETLYSTGELNIGNRGWLSNTNSIDSSTSANGANRVVMFGEYGVGLYDADPTYRIWKTVNQGVTWTPSLEIRGDYGALGTGEIRHFHCVQKDPYVAGQWFASAGDENSQCKIFRTTDDGDTWEQIFPIAGVEGAQRERTCSFIIDKDYIYYGMDTPTVGVNNVKLFRIDKAKIGTVDENGNHVDPREEIGTVDSGYPVYCLTRVNYPEGFLVWTVFEKSTNNITNRIVVEFYDYKAQKLISVGTFDITDAMVAGHDYVGFTGASRFSDFLTGQIVVMPHFTMQQGRYGYTAVSRHIRVRLTM